MYERIDFNKRSYVRQPNFQRSRQPLRAPINSVTTNLEDHQFSYDIYNVQFKLDELTGTINEDYEDIEEMLITVIENLQLFRKRLNAIEGN